MAALPGIAKLDDSCGWPCGNAPARGVSLSEAIREAGILDTEEGRALTTTGDAPALPSAWRFAFAGVYVLIGLVVAAVFVGSLVRGVLTDLERLPISGGEVALDEGRYTVFVEYPFDCVGGPPESAPRAAVRVQSGGTAVPARSLLGGWSYSTLRGVAHAVAVFDAPAQADYRIDVALDDVRPDTLVIIPALIPVVVRGAIGLGLIGLVTLTVATVSLVRTAKRRERAKRAAHPGGHPGPWAGPA